MKDLKSNDIASRQGNFYLKNIPPVGGMVIIKTDWCSHCQRALPEFEEVSKLTGGIFPIYKLDGDKNKELVNSMGVSGFPTIKFINPDGQISDNYQGTRDKKSILDGICKRSKKCY
jgi:thiol-disulfide isomerase/thioredoxin